MVLAVAVPRSVFIGSGTRGPFNLLDTLGNPYRVTATGLLNVRRYSSVTDEVGVQLNYPDDYVLGGTTDARTISLTLAQTVLASTERLVVERENIRSQDLNIDLGGDYSGPAVMSRLDKIEEQLQEDKRDIGRSVQMSWRSTEGAKLPIAPATTKLLGHNPDDGIEHVDLGTVDPNAVAFGSGWLTALGLPFASIIDNLPGIRPVATYAALTALVAATGLADGGVYANVARTTVAEVNDGSAGIWRYDAASTATADGGTILAIDGGGAGRFFRIWKGKIDVRWFGAKGDGATNDATAIQAAFTLARTVGATVYASAGRYLINSTVTLDNSGHNGQTSNGGVGLVGDGPNNTVFVNGSGGVGIHIKQDMASIGQGPSKLVLRGFMVTKTGGGTSDIGLKLDTLSVFALYDVFCTANSTGMRIEDCVSGSFYSCEWSFNKYGLEAVGQTPLSNGGELSTANAMEWAGCLFYGNTEYHCYGFRPCNWKFSTTKFETMVGGVVGVRFALKIEEPGQYGASVLTLSNCYFERNENAADVWVVAGDYPCVVTVVGTSFNRTSSTEFVTNNIKFDNNSNTLIRHKLILLGNGFRQFGTYSSNVGRKYVAVTGTTPVETVDEGNYWNVEIERPVMTTGRVYSRGVFQSLSTTPALYRGFNVASISRTGTGVYVITHQDPSYDGFKLPMISTDLQGGQARITAATTTTTTIEIRNNAGSVTDPGVLNVILWE